MEQLSFSMPVKADLVAYIDGGARGNPGESGFGVVLQDSLGNVVKTLQGYLGIATNNIAEYQALIAALETARAMKCRRIQVFSDSQLIVSQIRGFYRVSAAHLKPLYDKVRMLVRDFSDFSIVHIPREQNREADRLANAAIDEKTPWP